MSLKNSWHTELAIGILINDEESLDDKLSLLTEISITATNKETFAICEKIRDRLCSQKDKSVELRDIHRSESGRDDSGDSGKEEFNGFHGA